jgi:hypothetical protein
MSSLVFWDNSIILEALSTERYPPILIHNFKILKPWEFYLDSNLVLGNLCLPVVKSLDLSTLAFRFSFGWADGR